MAQMDKKISEDKKFVIYGAAAGGKVVFEKLEKCGKTVIAFIDRRADELNDFFLGGVPVFSPDAIPAGLISNDDTVVIISVKNVFEHTSIANALFTLGARTIIYMPRSVLEHNATDIQMQIGDLYNRILNGEWDGKGKIPVLDIKEQYQFEDICLIKQENGMVWARIPVEYIFINLVTQVDTPWSDISIYLFFTHNRLFDWFSGRENGNPEAYLKYYCEYGAKREKIKITDAWRESVLHNRNEVYEQMEMFLETDPDFFVRNAANAKWNKDHFNLLSGKHRTTFLLSKGFRFIPLCMTKQDYDVYINNSKADNVIEYFKDVSIDTLNFPIFHPMFFKYAHNGGTAYNVALKKITDLIASENFERKQQVKLNDFMVVDLLNDCGTFSRCFVRMGCRVYCRSENKLEQMLDELMHVSEKRVYVDGINEEEKFDLLLVDMRTTGFFEMEKIKASYIIAFSSIEEVDKIFSLGYKVQMLSDFSSDKGNCKILLITR